jgi:hypothetical protein
MAAAFSPKCGCRWTTWPMTLATVSNVTTTAASDQSFASTIIPLP